MSVIPESDREQEDIADSSIRKITDRQEYPDMSGVRVSWERLSSDRHRLELMLARINPITPPWRSVDYSKQIMESPHPTPAL